MTNARSARYDAVVLGAGISGMVSTAILLEQRADRVLVVDEYAQAGGNHLDVTIGPYTFDVGSFIFQDDSPLLRWFPELVRSYVPIEPSWARLNPQGRVTDYPFSIREDLLRAGPLQVALILASVAVARIRRRRQENALDFAEYWLGPRLVRRAGLLHYMERFCGIAADRIDLQFAKSRMGWIAEYARLRTHVDRIVGRLKPRPRESPTVRNQQLARPRAGFGSLYAPVVKHLEAEGAEFRLGLRPDRIERDAEGFVLHLGGERITAGRIVSTVPIDHALSMVGIESEPLPTVTLVSLFYSFSGERGFSTSILYNFSSTAAWKRLTVYSDFYGKAEGRTYFAVEVIARSGYTSIDEAAEEFRRHTAENGLLSGDLRLEGGHVLGHAYPIYTAGSDARARAGVDALRRFGFESLGRQGGFAYQPTARVSTRTVEKAFGVAPVDVPPLLGRDRASDRVI